MSRKYGTFSGSLLKLVGEATGFFTWPFEFTESYRYEQLRNYKSKTIYDNLYSLKKQGYLKSISKNGKLFFEITRKGEMEILFLKSHSHDTKSLKWDGKWRLAFFDIPEEAREKRDKLRKLLKDNGFKKLQASVFISPNALHRDAITYLKSSGLIQFLRFARIDEIDDDKELKKQFKLV